MNWTTALVGLSLSACGMIEIPLTQGQVALVDDCDVALAAFKWCATRDTRRYYARRNGRVYLHRVIAIRMGLLDALEDKRHIDHIDGNGCNNQRANLRLATPRENQWNTRKQLNCSSQYKGVSFDAHRGWRVQISDGKIQANGNARLRHIGYFDTELDAALAYDAAARTAFGEFACTNF
jgi:hypothetical protein